MRYKTGRYTTGATLLVVGILILLHQVTATDWIQVILKIWPLVFIGYGVEYLIASRRPERARFDFGGAFFVVVLIGAISVFSFFGSFLFHIGESKYSAQDAPIIYESSGVHTIDVHGLFGSITIEASDDERITIVPTYHSAKDKSLEQMKQDVGMSSSLKDGTLAIKGHRLLEESKGIRFFGFKTSGVDLHIVAPKHIAAQIEHSFGNVITRGMENVRKVELDFGDVDLYDAKGDMRLAADFGDITLHNFVGALDADVSFGQIKVNGHMLGRWDVSTDFGSVKLALSKESSFQYYFDVDFGSVHSPFANEESGVFNGGAHALRVDVSFGSIDIETK